MKERIQKYLTKSKWSIASDIIFVLLAIALLIPTSRRAVMVTVKRAVMFQPAPERVDHREQLLKEDYQWELQSLDGEFVSLEDFKGKVLFINFWATWCPPCLAEMPSIQKLYDQYGKNDQIAFLFISNEDAEVVSSFMDKRQFNFPVYKGLQKTPDKLYSASIPKTFIVSKSGKIVLDKTGSAKWHGEKVMELIDGLLQE